jgi:Cu2+-exporting ATPase
VVTGVAAAPGATEDEVLRLAAGVDLLARAIVTAARERGGLAAASDFRSLTGRGVEATVGGRSLAVGGPALLRKRGLEVPAEVRDPISGWQGRGAAVLHLVDEAGGDSGEGEGGTAAGGAR